MYNDERLCTHFCSSKIKLRAKTYRIPHIRNTHIVAIANRSPHVHPVTFLPFKRFLAHLTQKFSPNFNSHGIAFSPHFPCDISRKATLIAMKNVHALKASTSFWDVLMKTIESETQLNAINGKFKLSLCDENVLGDCIWGVCKIRHHSHIISGSAGRMNYVP